MGQALNTNTNVEDLLQSVKQFVIKHEKDFDPMVNHTARQSGVELRPFKERGHRNSLRLAMIPAHSIPHTRTQFIVT